jgi:mono/diheme cytochrome c family protein
MSMKKHSVRSRCGSATVGMALAAALVSAQTLSAGEAADPYRDRTNPETLEESELRYYQRQFKGKCSRCHGADGTGKGKGASDEVVQPANFTDVDYMASRTDGQLFRQILLGGEDRCAMPAFGPESDHAWSEEKIWHMVAFVRRFAQEPSP